MPDELDTILDKAIRSYSAVEPSPDLAGRILRQAQMQAPLPRRGWKLALAFGLPLAAALALALVLAGQWALPKPPAAVASAAPAPTVAIRTHAQPAETLVVARREPVSTHRRVRKTSWARPLPAPYSKEELALLNFVQQHPKEAAEVAEAQKQSLAPLSSEPITISRLQIEPISIAPLR